MIVTALIFTMLTPPEFTPCEKVRLAPIYIDLRYDGAWMGITRSEDAPILKLCLNEFLLFKRDQSYFSVLGPEQLITYFCVSPADDSQPSLLVGVSLDRQAYLLYYRQDFVGCTDGAPDWGVHRVR